MKNQTLGVPGSGKSDMIGAPLPGSDQSDWVGVPLWKRGAYAPLPEIPLIGKRGNEPLEVAITALDDQHLHVVWKNHTDSRGMLWRIPPHDLPSTLRRLLACVCASDDVFAIHSDVCAALPDEAARFLVSVLSTSKVPDFNNKAKRFQATFQVLDAAHGGVIHSIDCSSRNWSIKDDDTIRCAGLER